MGLLDFFRRGSKELSDEQKKLIQKYYNEAWQKAYKLAQSQRQELPKFGTWSTTDPNVLAEMGDGMYATEEAEMATMKKFWLTRKQMEENFPNGLHY